MDLTRTIAGLALVPLLAAAGCGNGGGAEDDGGGGGGYASSPTPTGEDEGGAAAAQGHLVEVGEEFETYSEGATAVTYDEEMVPPGSRVELTVTSEGSGSQGAGAADADADGDGDGDDGDGDAGDDADDGTEFSLRVTGLAPDEEYGAHMHTGACGENPDDSGPHYQNEEDPEQPSTDPEYANDDNEVWLDFTTDSDGNADSDADVDWMPRSGEMKSLVIHAEHTKTGADEAGTAGDRLACVNAEV